MTEAGMSRSTEGIGSSMMTGTRTEDAAGSVIATEMGVEIGTEIMTGLDIDDRTAHQPCISCNTKRVFI